MQLKYIGTYLQCILFLIKYFDKWTVCIWNLIHIEIFYNNYWVKLGLASIQNYHSSQSSKWNEDFVVYEFFFSWLTKIISPSTKLSKSPLKYTYAGTRNNIYSFNIFFYIEVIHIVSDLIVDFSSEVDIRCLCVYK